MALINILTTSLCNHLFPANGLIRVLALKQQLGNLPLEKAKTSIATTKVSLSDKIHVSLRSH